MSEIDLYDESTGLNDAGQDVNSFAPPELSQEEHAEHTANMVANSLAATKMFGVVEVMAGVGQVHILGRVKASMERRFAETVVYPTLLCIEKDDDANGFIGKQYVFKDGHEFDDMKYAWVISFASTDLRAVAGRICEAFDRAIPRVEVTESPLMGSATPQSGGQRSGRKGASPIGA